MSNDTSAKKRILTGDNATGKLHVGHLVGSLENRVKLQDEYETFIIIADMPAFAYPKYISHPDVVADSVLQIAMDNLAVGLDPKKAYIFQESAIPEIFELSMIFSMLTTHSRVLRNPTLKEEIIVKEMGDNYSLGFVNFPVLQVADILGLRADLVPVGEDQLPHVELTDEIAKKFNSLYGELFKEPAPLVGRVKRLVGLDGNAKMSKSMNNTIYLSDDEKTLKQKIMTMYTDPNRIHATDPGKVEGNPVFIYHDAFNKNTDEVNDLKSRYLKGTVGDVEVKEKLFTVLNELLTPIRERRTYYENHQDEVKDIISQGVFKTGAEVKKTLLEVKEHMQLREYN
jgi:tryptophanyl-tRNA synthetase